MSAEADSPPEAPTEAPEGQRIASLEAEVTELKERWLRTRADYENLQKRTTRDAQAERERAKARVVEGFIPLWDLAHMAAHQAASHPGPLAEGVVLLAREFDRFAKREGLSTIGALGDAVAAARHEVVATEPAEGVEAGRVSRVVQSGVLVDGKVLRYAKVCVAP
ncbi:MAG: nucleotide exchange factor GrpE [Thermoplasmatota archaeon]